MNQVLDMSGNLRKFGREIEGNGLLRLHRENAAFILDIIQAFGIASQQHNEDIRQIIGKILETAGN